MTKDRPIILSEINTIDLKTVSQISPEEYLQCFEEQGYVPRLIGPEGVCGAKIRDASIDWRDGVVVNVALIPAEKE